MNITTPRRAAPSLRARAHRAPRPDRALAMRASPRALGKLKPRDVALLDSILSRVHASMPARSEAATAGAREEYVVGLSGGVDSAVAAWALERCGARATATLMRNWDARDEDAATDCSHRDDLKSARAIAEKLNLRFIESDFTREYWHEVFEPYVEAFESGATPNPDLECNRRVKFGALLRRAMEDLGGRYLATGHYARIDRDVDEGAPPRLLRGIDQTKDQSYFLASVRGEALRSACFPLGAVFKSETREAARILGFDCADRRSSAGICFIGRRPFGEFIGEYITPSEGAFVDAETARPVPGAAPHRGLASYTVGQRAKIGGAPKPWFVVGKNVAANVVYVAKGAEHDALYSTRAALADEFWISNRRPTSDDGSSSVRLLAKTRYASSLTPVTLSVASDDETFTKSRFSSSFVPRVESSPLRATFDRPERAVTPGQALVLYDGDVCLGGGVIEHVGVTEFEARAAS